ncbi:PAS domain S-box protein [Paenibacillus sp. sgz500958]|uniref:PAS domain S-box protein n=1 Tax=Paenibacillus sp. sgz500958 TaxID=3242475 RepID=UPI0036D25811
MVRTVNTKMKEQPFTTKTFSSQIVSAVTIALLIFIAGYRFRLFIAQIYPNITELQEAVLDGLFIVVLVIPALYRFVYRPITQYMDNITAMSEQLRKSQEIFGLYLENASDMITILDEKGIIQYQNSSAERLFGYKPEEYTGRSIFDLIHPEDLPMLLDFFHTHADRAAVSSTVEFRMQHLDGSWHDIESIWSNLLHRQDMRFIIVNSRDISDRKASERRLKENEQRYRSLFIHNHAVMLLIDPESAEIKDANAAAIRFYGYDREILLQMKITEINMLRAYEVYGELAKARGSHTGSLQFRHRLANGQIRDVEVYSGAITVSGKELLFSIVHDISERLEIERLLKSSEARYRFLMENAPVGIVTCNKRGNILEVNPALLKLLGSPSIEATKAVNVLTLASMVECGMSTDIQRCLETGEAVISEYSYTSKWGRKLYIRCQLAALYDSFGNIEGVQGVFDDLSQHKRIEDELHTLYHAVEHSPVAVVITDTKGRIEYVNPKCIQLTGYTAEELLGQNPRILQSGETKREVYQELWNLITCGNVWEGEFHNKKKSGVLYWEKASVSPVFNADGAITHFVSVKEDITERKHADEKINYLAFHDPLTELPNRTLFHDRFNIALVNASRYQQSFALMILDLDGFKQINDTFGHDVGDELLHEVARVLRKNVREGDTVSRIGGDEFTIILSHINKIQDLESVARKILRELGKPLTGMALVVTASIGIALYGEHGTELEELFKHADAAMYRAKERGKNNFQIGESRQSR